MRHHYDMLFGHLARLDATTPAHQILKQVIAVKSAARRCLAESCWTSS